MSTATSRYPAATRAAAVSLLPAILATGCSLQPNENTLPGQVATGSDGYTVTVRFESVENLVPNSQVLLDDVVIGTVTDIRVEDWHAAADLRLLESVPIARDARFTVGQKTLLGAQYVQVSSDTTQATTGAAELLEEGDDVPLASTDQAPGTEQVLAGVALLLNNGGLSQISTITDELTSALADRQLDARSLVTRSNELLAVLDVVVERGRPHVESPGDVAHPQVVRAERDGRGHDLLAGDLLRSPASTDDLLRRLGGGHILILAITEGHQKRSAYPLTVENVF